MGLCYSTRIYCICDCSLQRAVPLLGGVGLINVFLYQKHRMKN